jgi:hypothetical protein
MLQTNMTNFANLSHDELRDSREGGAAGTAP